MIKYIAILLIAAVATLGVGCAAYQKTIAAVNAAQSNAAVQKAEAEAAKLLKNAGTAALTQVESGQTLNSAWAIQLGLNSINQAVTDTVSNQQAAALITSTVNTFATDPKLASLGADLAKTFLTANPTTAAGKQAVVQAMAVGSSNGLVSALTALPAAP